MLFIFSIQRCSVWVLEQYYCDFPVYNPALMRTPSKSLRMKQLNNHKFKEYNVDGKNRRFIVSHMYAMLFAFTSYSKFFYSVLSCNVRKLIQ